MKEFIAKYAEELGEMAALHLLKHKLHATQEEFDEGKNINECLNKFHEMFEDFMKARGMEIPGKK